jgi:hypothetical protein
MDAALRAALVEQIHRDLETLRDTHVGEDPTGRTFYEERIAATRAALLADDARTAPATFDLIDTWNGGKGGERVVYTGTENACFEWVHANTPFSFSEATKRQGYVLRARQ